MGWLIPNHLSTTFIKHLKLPCNMVIVQARARRKPTGGRYRSTLSKRTHMLGRTPTRTKVGDKERRKEIGTKGGNVKQRLFETTTVNLFDTKAKKYVKAKVSSVAENPANRNFARRNIITKGTIIETDKGRARVTSRPGQDGVLNAVLE